MSRLFAVFGLCFVACIFATCRGPCVSSDDCAAGGDPCKTCFLGVCDVGCGSPCTDDSQCLDPNCQICSNGPKGKVCNGTAIHNVTCGGECTLDVQCKAPCQTCFTKDVNASVLTPGCGSGCNQTCEKDTDCHDKNCKVCGVDKKCYQYKPNATACGEKCTTDAQCGGGESADCKVCYFKEGATDGICTASCNMPCKDDKECLESQCSACVKNPLGNTVCGAKQG
eukprot:NODE_1832_length_829_cov_932.201282_g1447_i0.p2 GENE.NODE_1832_length_829_cov_932.201282_g1447_i0~~NODE_1832_length_829_cov_932.201282_g1447_i0.p2  ORF type:complete len:242 (+),score=67.79 NODE_1832_length_829_cov_932.201282_g1447_i0:52-726(+)